MSMVTTTVSHSCTKTRRMETKHNENTRHTFQLGEEVEGVAVQAIGAQLYEVRAHVSKTCELEKLSNGIYPSDTNDNNQFDLRMCLRLQCIKADVYVFVYLYNMYEYDKRTYSLRTYVYTYSDLLLNQDATYTLLIRI